jgi:hypothetical protein
MKKIFALDWYDENEQGEIVCAGTTIFSGTLEERKAMWDKLAMEHTACYLRAATREELDSYRYKYIG